MSGILIVDKPEGLTSHDVIYQVRKILKIKAVGHTGTLDPFATGVLVILIGRATRLAQFLDKAEKEYLATIQFGFETETGDRTGSPKESRITNYELRTAKIEKALSEFRGEVWQTPPMYSAKKIAGKKLYELARQGQEIERQSVPIKISKLEIAEEFDEKSKIQNPKSKIQVRVVCSAGTYIRVLAEDIGKKLGVGAHLAELRRTRAGSFDLEQAVTLGELENLVRENALEKVLISPGRALAHLPFVKLDEAQVLKVLNGMKISIENQIFNKDQFVRMCDARENLVAVGIFDEETQTIQPRVVLSSSEKA